MSYLKEPIQSFNIIRTWDNKAVVISNFDHRHLYFELKAINDLVTLTFSGKVYNVHFNDTRSRIIKCLPEIFRTQAKYINQLNAYFSIRNSMYAELIIRHGKYNICIDNEYHIFSAPSRLGMCELPYKWFRCQY